MITVSTAMIVKNEGDTIERVLSCAKSFSDELIVVDTGSTDDTVAKAKALGAIVHHFAWIDDFAAARNFSFSKCSQDWILWLDGDDVIPPESQERIRRLKGDVSGRELEAIYLRYVYPPFRQWRERMVRRELFESGKLQWREPVHECIDGIDPLKVEYHDEISILHAAPPERHLRKKDRNVAILRKQFRQAGGAVSERTLFIYAVECLHGLLKKEAERTLEVFFERVGVQEYRYEVLSKMYDFYIHFGKTARALDALAKAIVEDPSRAEAYYKLGKHLCDRSDQPAAAIPLLTAASMIEMPRHGTPEIEAYTHGPWESLCRAHFRLGNYDEASQMARKAIERGATRPDWLAELASLERVEPTSASLPAQWQEWAEGNLQNGVPRWTVARILEENDFGPRQIISALQGA